MYKVSRVIRMNRVDGRKRPRHQQERCVHVEVTTRSTVAWNASDTQQKGARACGEESSCPFGKYGNVLSSLPFSAETDVDPVRERAPRSDMQRPAPKHVLSAI